MVELRGAAAPQTVDGVDDPWFGHFLRYLALSAVVALAAAFLVGYLWLAFLLTRTGRRKRDVVLCMIPLLGSVIMAQTMWRAIARTTYWSARHDRPSGPLQGTARRGLLVVGALLWPLFAIVMAVSAVTAATAPGWTDPDRAALYGDLAGYDENPMITLCMAERIEEQYPDGPESLPTETAEIQELLVSTERACR